MKDKNGHKYDKLRVELGALATGMFYQAQMDRIDAFNRIRNIIYRKTEKIGLTQKQGKKEDKDYEKKYTDTQLLKLIRQQLPKMKAEKQEYVMKMVDLLEDMREKEGKYKSLMKFYIESEPIYSAWLCKVKGISTINTANLLQYFGYCEKAKHASSLWKFAGLTPDSKKEKGKSLDFSPKLRTLMYRIGDCFIKQRTPKYRQVYDRAKAEYVKRHLRGGCEKCNELKRADMPGHPDAMARRKMVKAFLLDYWTHACEVVGRDAGVPFSARFHKE